MISSSALAIILILAFFVGAAGVAVWDRLPRRVGLLALVCWIAVVFAAFMVALWAVTNDMMY